MIGCGSQRNLKIVNVVVTQTLRRNRCSWRHSIALIWRPPLRQQKRFLSRLIITVHEAKELGESRRTESHKAQPGQVDIRPAEPAGQSGRPAGPEPEPEARPAKPKSWPEPADWSAAGRPEPLTNEKARLPPGFLGLPEKSVRRHSGGLFTYFRFLSSACAISRWCFQRWQRLSGPVLQLGIVAAVRVALE